MNVKARNVRTDTTPLVDQQLPAPLRDAASSRPSASTLREPIAPGTPPSHTSRWLLDIPETCRELHLSRAALYRLLASGELGSIKLGRRRLVPVTELERFIADRMEQCGLGGDAA